MKKYSLRKRASFYAKTFPDWPAPRADDRWLDSMWVLGNNYRNQTRYYGAYPPGYLKRVHSLFPDAERTLHLFSGSMPKSDQYVRFECNPKLEPDVEGDAHALSTYFDHAQFDFIIADPPYDKDAAARYGFPMINRPKIMVESAYVLEKGGYLVWLDTVLPMFRKELFHLCGLIGVVRSTNHKFRVVSIFKKVGEPQDAAVQARKPKTKTLKAGKTKRDKKVKTKTKTKGAPKKTKAK